MKSILVSGLMGSGKTQFCKKLVYNRSHNILNFSRPYIHIEADIIGKFFLQDFFRKNILYKKQKNFHKKHTILSTDMQMVEYVLFFSVPILQNIFWYQLENFSHPLIEKKIISIQKKFSQKKGTLIFDCALPQQIYIAHEKHLCIRSKKIYPHIFLLKKHRKISYKKILFFLRKQKKNKNSVFHN